MQCVLSARHVNRAVTVLLSSGYTLSGWGSDNVTCGNLANRHSIVGPIVSHSGPFAVCILYYPTRYITSGLEQFQIAYATYGQQETIRPRISTSLVIVLDPLAIPDFRVTQALWHQSPQLGRVGVRLWS